MCLFVLINCLELLYVISTVSSQKAHFTENVLKRGGGGKVHKVKTFSCK